MDDLKQLREMRAEAPEPDASQLASVRARVLAPASGTAGRGAAKGRGVLRKLNWRFALPGVCAAGVTLVLIAGQLGGDAGNGTPEQGAEAAAFLERAASVTEARRTAPQPRPHQWVYSKTLGKQDNEKPYVEEEWERYDGRMTAAYQKDTCDGKLEKTPKLRVCPVELEPGSDDLSPQQYASKVNALPLEPRALLAHVKNDKHWSAPQDPSDPPERPDDRAFRVLSLYVGVSPRPKVQAAIYRAMAILPGIRIDRGVTDLAGRAGIGVMRNGDQGRDTLILEPRTYRYLGDSIKNADGTAAWAELAEGIVDKPGQRP